MRMKKFLTFLLTIAMVVSLLPATAFAANHTATTMRLAKTQGTVTVTNATGKKVTQTSNMKLYNGYKLKTGAKSYAWISLDDTKVAKLDASSVVSVQKSGQKLTLYLSSGNIFFNVKEPMKSGESLHIKTSTMTTGIRGTSGCVRVINPRVSEIHLLTGRIEVFAEHPELHLTKSEVLTAGNMATSLIDREAMQLTGEQVEIIVEELQEQNVCGNCATEVAADPELQERIEEETDMDVEEIVNDAEEKLAEDELAAEEEQAAIEEAEAEQDMPEDVDPYFQEETASGGGGGGSSSTPTVSTEVNVSTWIQLYNALTQYNEGSGIKRINLQDENGNGVEITGVGETTTLPAIQNKGELTLYLGESKLTLNDTLVNKGNLIIDNAQGILTGDITAFEENDYTYPNLIRNTGTLTQKNGTLYMPQDFGACIAVYNDGTFNMEGGTIENASGWGVHAVENDNDAVFNLSGGTINFSGEDSSAVYNTGSMIMDDGTINLYDGAWAIDNVYAGTLTMSGGIINAGDTGTVGINSVWEEGSLNLSENAVINVTGAEALGIEAQTNLTMTGGTINVSGASAVGVDIYGGAVTMKGGTIQTSKNTNDTGAGTGIRIIDGIFTMNNGSITGEDSGTVGISVNAEHEPALNLNNGSITYGLHATAISVDPCTQEELDAVFDTPIETTIKAKFDPDDANYANGVFNCEDRSLSGVNIYPSGYVVRKVDAAYCALQPEVMVIEVADADQNIEGTVTLKNAVRTYNNSTDTTVPKYIFKMVGATSLTEGTEIKNENTNVPLEIDLNGQIFHLDAHLKNSETLAITDHAGGGKILNDNYAYTMLGNSGTLVMEDVVMESSTAQWLVQNNGTMTVDGVSMTLGTTNEQNGCAAISNNQNCTLTVKDSTITVASTATGEYGIHNSGTLTMTGSTITTEAAGSTGVQVGTGTATIGDDNIFYVKGGSTGIVKTSTSNAMTIGESTFHVTNGTGISNTSEGTGNTVTIDGAQIEVGLNAAAGINNTGTLKFESGTINLVNSTVVGIKNSGTATFSGTIKTKNGDMVSGTGAVENNGTLVMNDGSIASYGYGVKTTGGIFTMTGGEIRASGIAGVYAEGGTVTFDGGTVTALNEYVTAAVVVKDPATVDMTDGIQTTIRATEQDALWSNALPDGYGSVYDDGYFVMIKALNEVAFIQALHGHDGSSNTEIILTQDLDITEDKLNAALGGSDRTELTVNDTAQADKTLTINLNGNTLNFAGTSLKNNAAMIITDSVGTGEISGDAAVIINNTGELRLQDATLNVNKNSQTGIQNTDNGKVYIEGGTVDVSGESAYGVYSTGDSVTISDSASINLNADESTGVYAADGDVIMNDGNINPAYGNTIGIHAVGKLLEDDSYVTANVCMSGGRIIGGANSSIVGIKATDIATLEVKENAFIQVNLGTGIDTSAKETVLSGGTIEVLRGIGVNSTRTTVADDSVINLTGTTINVYEGTGIQNGTGDVIGGTFSMTGGTVRAYASGTGIANNSGDASITGGELISVDGGTVYTGIDDADVTVGITVETT